MSFSREGNRIIYTVDNEIKGELNFTKEGDVMTVTRTFIDPSLRGQGIARKLVDSLVDEACVTGMKIFPRCSYVANLFDKEEAYNKVDARKHEIEE